MWAARYFVFQNLFQFCRRSLWGDAIVSQTFLNHVRPLFCGFFIKLLAGFFCGDFRSLFRSAFCSDVNTFPMAMRVSRTPPDPSVYTCTCQGTGKKFVHSLGIYQGKILFLFDHEARSNVMLLRPNSDVINLAFVNRMPLKALQGSFWKA